MKRAALALLVCLAAPGAWTQYPTKPLRLISPFPPGAVVDTLSRALAAPLGERLESVDLTPAPGTPEEFGRYIAGELEGWAKVAKAASVRAE